MTDWTTPQTARPLTPDAAAGPTPQVSTSNKSVGVDPSFKFTRQEFEMINQRIAWYTQAVFRNQSWNAAKIESLVNDIEKIINDGWQTCACDAD